MSMNFFAKLRLSGALLLSLTVFMLATPVVFGESAEQVTEVRDLLEKYHLSKPTDDELKSNVIDDMVKSLNDPYTEYFDQEEWNSFNSALEQTFVGIGIVMEENNGIAHVQDVIAGSPAQTAGLQPGDVLKSADGQALTNKSMEDIQSMIKGKEGTKVVVGIVRDGKPLTFSIVRKSIQIPIVTTRVLGNGVGYISLSGFTSDSGNQFKQQLSSLEQKGISSLVVDLRDNGGGYVNAAQEIASLFVKDGVLAHMNDRDGVDHPLEVKGSVKPYPVVILVNSNTASASELLSGALQDYGVAKLVGTRTYGKGVVQSIVPVQSGGVLKVTIEEYFTPKGRKVNKVGLVPDLALDNPVEQLVEGYRMAGGKNVTFKSGQGELTVNGVRMAQPDVSLKDNKNVWYFNIKLAASLAGAKLKYDASKHTYLLTKGNVVRTIATNDSHLKIQNGTSNIDVRLLAKWFAGVTFSASGDMLTLSAS
jgi:carboxyl-terminal processing protease